MQPPRKREGADGRPRLSVVISELRSRESGVDRERKRRLAAHPLEFDERDVPVDQLRLPWSSAWGGSSLADQRADKTSAKEPAPQRRQALPGYSDFTIRSDGRERASAFG